MSRGGRASLAKIGNPERIGTGRQLATWYSIPQPELIPMYFAPHLALLVLLSVTVAGITNLFVGMW